MAQATKNFTWPKKQARLDAAEGAPVTPETPEPKPRKEVKNAVKKKGK